VLEGCAVPVSHEVADQSARALGIRIEILQGLLAARRHARREHDIGIAGRVPHELDRDIAAELDLGHTRTLVAATNCAMEGAADCPM
jgi:hypothetical protein